MKINWKDVLKFVSGFAFGDATINAVLYLNHTSVSLFGFTESRELWGIRIVLQFVVALVVFYFGFLRKEDWVVSRSFLFHQTTEAFGIKQVPTSSQTAKTKTAPP